MKQSIVAFAAGVAVCLMLVLLFLVGGVKYQARARPSASGVSDGLEYKKMRDFAGEAAGYDDMPSPSAAPEPEQRQKGEEGRMGKKEKAALRDVLGDTGGVAGLLGSGTGGLGFAGPGGAAASPKLMKRMNTIQVIRGGKAPPADAEAPAEAATRAWFPETFLFEPLVVTDERGMANVPVKVPDRLTAWRVLGLAHSRQGGQAGATASFLGTLPTYVEPVTPPLLYAGDEVRLPIQVVNTTDADVKSGLRYQAVGATLSSAGGQVRVPAGGSVVEYVTLKTQRPGQAAVKATLGETDAVERTIDVQPAGKRELVSKGGTLAAPREYDLEGPANALPYSESVRLQVFPGALGLLRTELSAAPGRGGVAEDGYLLQLLGSAPSLLRSLGAEPASDALRDLSILATQRVMRHARAPSVEAATLLAEGALAHPDNPVLARLGERLAGQVAQAQRPDGTCQGADGWTLQRLLVTTAECVRAVKASEKTPTAKQRATAVTVKASGAFERNAARVTDGYTAAAILSSGAVGDTLKEKLKALVLAGLETTADGAKYLKVESGVQRPDGVAPSTYEATALAVLALLGDEKAPVADLGTYLLGGYNPVWGWGDGRTNLVALRAAVLLFRDPVPQSVRLVLERDGKVLAEGEFGAAKLQELVTLEGEATGSSGKHAWKVRAEPAVPGLGYSLTLAAFVPWKSEPGGGLDLRTKLPDKVQVGRAAELELTASMPSNLATSLRLALPAGVQPDTTSLESLVDADKVLRYETEDGAVTLHLPPLTAGAVWEAKLKVVPTLAGKLQSSASKLGPEGQPAKAKAFAPLTWTIK